MHTQADIRLAEAVRDRLRLAVDASGMACDSVTVHANDGCVELLGTVPSWTVHKTLERIALQTPGVSKVDNQLALLVKARLVEPVG